MPNRYLRSIRVTLGENVGMTAGVIVTDLYMKFRIRKEATGTPAEGQIDIYNLSEANEARIRERAQRVLLEVGYQGRGLLQLFLGTIRRVERQKVDLDRVTRIHVGGNLSVRGPGQQPRAAFIKSYEGIVAVRTIIMDAIMSLGLEAGPLDLIPADLMEADFRYTGDARVFLTQFLRQYSFHWYIDDGVVRLSRYRQPLEDRPAGIDISERTGMIGTPTITDDGVRVRTLLDPRLTLGSQIRIESIILGGRSEVSGADWKVVELTHTGDNREGGFETSIEGRPISREPPLPLVGPNVTDGALSPEGIGRSGGGRFDSSGGGGAHFVAPNMLSVVQRVAAENPVALQNACVDGDWRFMDALITALRQSSNRWGYNCKRGNCSDLSQDAIAYYFGEGNPTDGSSVVAIVDVVAGCKSLNPQPGWLDQTRATAAAGSLGRWKYPR